MKLGILLVSLLLSHSVLATMTFGKGASKSSLTPISKLLENPMEFNDKKVTVSGTITSVCKKRGCWMKFSSDKKYQTLRIKVRDGDMVFPVTARGKTGYATGTFKAMKIPRERALKRLKHMAEEHGEKFDPSTVPDPYLVYQLHPEGVTIE
jgi:hypothetical protein